MYFDKSADHSLGMLQTGLKVTDSSYKCYFVDREDQNEAKMKIAVDQKKKICTEGPGKRHCLFRCCRTHGYGRVEQVLGSGPCQECCPKEEGSGIELYEGESRNALHRVGAIFC